MAMFKRPYSGRRVGKEPKSKKPDAPKRAEGGPLHRLLYRFTAWWGKRRLAVRIAIIAGASVLALGMVAAIAVRAWIRPPEETPIVVHNPSPSDSLPSGASPAPTPSGGDETEPSPQPEYVQRKGIFTFLLAGVNEGLTDTLMVATLDTEQGTCYVLSIPRDTYIPSATRSLKKINGAYIQRNNVDEPGIAQLKKEVATLIGFQPQYAAVVNYNGFKRLITAIGGVDFYVPTRMYVPAEGIDLQKGQQHLNADKALQLVRWRVNYDEYGNATTGYNDQGRMETQQKLLTAAAKKALANWTKFPEYISIAQENLESDIDWGNMLWLAEQVNKIGMDNVEFHTLPTYTARIGKNDHEFVDAEQALELLNETINPFSIPIGPEILEHAKSEDVT
ncbi:MAG: LCP family protein [Oscillospiraceae bacterium]|jgi:LCP family protein required for cell wall assembly|nr:LCP family protein [Oscillospiraceae bacterium]